VSSKDTYLEFFVQAGRMLGSTGNRLAKINMVLVMLIDYFNIRNPVLLIRDSVTNSYYIELAPELDQEELTRANQQVAIFLSRYKRRFDFEQILFTREANEIPIMLPQNIDGEQMAFISCPIVGQDKSLQTGILMAYVNPEELIDEKTKLLRALAGQLGYYLDSSGSIPRRTYKSDLEEFPMVLDGIVGESPVIKQLGETIQSVASSRACVFIRGESGSGKELIAKNIHKCSLRSCSQFISLNCAAISEHLLLNELFGHEKGAFTGATTTTQGRFEVANGGTLFLDEIGETSVNFQTKLLRVLQEGEFERLGSNKTIKVDVRTVCATNADIEDLVRNRLFREDLYYRLNVLPIWAPSLADRREDIPVLARYFLMRLNQEYDKMIIIQEDQMRLLQQLEWPGNVRELENFMNRAFLMDREGLIDVEATLKLESNTKQVVNSKSVDTMPFYDAKANTGELELETEEKQAIESALIKTKGVQIKSAKILGITLRQLRYRIKKYGIVVRKVGI